jgi:hypothetical protein
MRHCSEESTTYSTCSLGDKTRLIFAIAFNSEYDHLSLPERIIKRRSLVNSSSLINALNQDKNS